jgi:PIN domain nuclease of toxin-antitoxin system
VRALLDTSTFIWAAGSPHLLSPRAAQVVADTGNDVYLSIASVWEIAIKVAVGKLTLADHPSSYVPSRVAAFALDLLPIELEHALRVADLPAFHKDPFDRMLIAQALSEGLPVITPDPRFARYGVEVVW